MKRSVLHYFVYLFLLTVSFSSLLAFEEGIRIAWDFKTITRISESNAYYPRMIRLSNNELLCSYEYIGKDGQVCVKVLRSRDEGKSWGDESIVVRGRNGTNPAVPEMLLLKNGDILLSLNWRPTADSKEKHFGIETFISHDQGQNWEKLSKVFEAGIKAEQGCWEPAQIQLPNGEIQLFIANEYPFPDTHEQLITLFRSFDLGKSWTKGKTISYSMGNRDGMPVPLILQNNKGIVISIEDNSIKDIFKPKIVWTSMEENWNGDYAGSTSSRRWKAIHPDFRIPDEDAGAAPYIVQLQSGETILSYHTTEGCRPLNWHKQDLSVVIGDDSAKNFSRKSKPFNIPVDRAAMWNSLLEKNEKTITALSSTTAFSKDGSAEIVSIDGHIFGDLHCPKARVKIDGKIKEKVWKQASQMFIGAYSETQFTVKTAWSKKYLYVLAEIDDTTFSNNDGFEIYFDPENTNTFELNHDIVILSIKRNGEVKTKAEVEVVDKGSSYIIEIAIPWFGLNSTKAIEEMGINFVLIDGDEKGEILKSETVSGNKVESPRTWCKLILETKEPRWKF